MRLSEMRKIIEDNMNNINEVNIMIKGAHDLSDIGVKKLSSKVVNTIENLYFIEALRAKIDSLKTTKAVKAIYLGEEKEIVKAIAEDISELSYKVKLLENSYLTILDVANTVLPKIPENTICIKLAPTSNLGDVAIVIKDFNFIFNNTSILFKDEDENPSATFIGVESGTEWFYILLQGSAFILFFNRFIDAASNAALKYAQVKKSFIELENIKINNDILKNIESLQKSINQHFFDEFIQDKNTISHEEKEALLLSFEKMIDLFIKGNEIHPSLTAPQEQYKQTASLMNALSEVTKDIKLLTEKQPAELCEEDKSSETKE